MVEIIISGFALAISLYTLVSNHYWRKKYEKPLKQLELMEKERAEKERKCAELQFMQLPNMASLPRKLAIKNVGVHSATNLNIKPYASGLKFCIPTDYFPFPQLEKGQEIVLEYYIIDDLNTHEKLIFTYSDGEGYKERIFNLLTV